MGPREEGMASGITLRAHPPERGRRRFEATAYSGCSSCCCCCLHSVGSLAGAVAGAYYHRRRQAPAGEKAPSQLAEDEIAGAGAERPATFPLGPIYWATTIGAAGLVTLVAILKSDPAVALFILALVLPLIQLGASLLAALTIAADPAARRDGRAWRRLGWITMGSALGCAAGLLAMMAMIAVLKD